MKNISRILTLLLALVLCFGMVACSDDEPEAVTDNDMADIVDEEEPDEPDKQQELDAELNLSGTLPESASYKKNDGSYILGNVEGGAEFPETEKGDQFYYGSYVYTYSDGALFDGVKGWIAEVYGRKDLETYTAILESVNGSPVISINACFEGCDKLLYAPKIPGSVITMTRAFHGCSNLRAVYEIPASVKEMDSAFYNCFALEGEIIVNATPDSYKDCFTNTAHPIKLTGDCANKAELAATALEGKITY